MKKDNANKGLLIKAFYQLGDVYNLIGRYKEGLQAYSKAETIVSDKHLKIRALVGQAKIYENLAEYDSMIKLLNRLLKLTRGTPEEVTILSRYCWVYRIVGRISKSNDAGNKGMELLKRLKKQRFSQSELSRIEGIMLNAMANLHWDQGDFDKAIELYKKYFKMSEKTGNLFDIGMALNNLGAVYIHRGDYDTAIPLLNKKLTISEKIGNKVGIAMAANNLGWIYCEKRNYDKAIELYEKALSIAEELDEKLGILHVTINLGSLYKNKANYDRAFALYQKATAIANKLGDKQAIGAVNLAYAEIYNDMDELQKAPEYLKKARIIFEELANKTFLASTVQIITEVGIKKLERNGIDNNGKSLKTIYGHLDEYSKLADEMNSKKERAGALFLQARLASIDEKYDKNNVKEIFARSIRMFDELNMISELGRAYYHYAIYLKKSDEPRIAVEFLVKAQEIFKRIGDTNYLSKIDEQ